MFTKHANNRVFCWNITAAESDKRKIEEQQGKQWQDLLYIIR